MNTHFSEMHIDAIRRLKERTPLVHNITNYVVMNWTANTLLALGASPIMAHAEEEVETMTEISNALVINIGTLSKHWMQSMIKACVKANQSGTPWVLDPVGIGATHYRKEAVQKLLSAAKPSVIRGNASEILELAGMENSSKGVDSMTGTNEAKSAAKLLAEQHDCTIVISGETDWIVSNNSALALGNGSPLMAKVTGMGCAATAVIGAFLGTETNAFLAASHAMATMGIAGQMAATTSQGPGSFAPNFLDSLHSILENNSVPKIEIKDATNIL